MNNKAPVKCSICGKEYSWKGIHTHMERTHLGLNNKYSSGNNGKYHTASFKQKITAAHATTQDKKYGKVEVLQQICECCKKGFTVTARPGSPTA